MKLQMMLFGLATILRRSLRMPGVRAKLRDGSRAVQIRTADGSAARYFVFSGGSIFSRRGLLESPDVSLIWNEARIAVRALRSSDPDALQTALLHGDLVIVGKGEVATRFGDLVRAAQNRTPRAVASTPTVAVIGLGRMGSGIARSLLMAGFTVTVYNRTEEKMRPLIQAGAKAAATPADAGRNAKFVITSLMDDGAVFTVVKGQDGLLASLQQGTVHIGASTISANAARRLAKLHIEHGSEYLATPVVGRPDAANAGELIAFVCGNRSAFEASRTVIESFTRQVHYLAEDHAVANAAKLAVNYSAVTIIDLMGQVYAFGEKAGVPLPVLHTMFRMMWAQPALQGYASKIWRREFDDVGFDLQGGLKDVTLMIDAAKELGVTWDFADKIQHKMTQGVKMGLGRKDWTYHRQSRWGGRADYPWVVRKGRSALNAGRSR